MTLTGSALLDFHLPTAATWLFLSLLLVAALFIRFDRPLSLRNWDLVSLFLLVPALLYLRDVQEVRRQAYRGVQWQESIRVAALVGHATTAAGSAALAPFPDWAGTAVDVPRVVREQADQGVWQAYLLLLMGSGYFLLRSLLDINLQRRPTYAANLNPGGLAFLGLTLLVVLGLEAFLRSEPAPETVSSAVMDQATNAAAMAVGDWIVRGAAILAQVAIVAGLVFVGGRHFQNWPAGFAAATLYLLLPYTAYDVDRLSHVLPTAFLIGAIAAYRSATAAGLCLGLATAVAYFPIFLFPLWLSFYLRRGAARFSVAYVAVLVAAAAVLWLGGGLGDEWQLAMRLPDWQAWDLSAVPKAEGLWTGFQLHYAYRVPLFIGYLALVGATAFWPARKDLGHLLALSAALIIGVQAWYADAGGTYVLWYLPLLVLLTLRPTLSDRVPPIVEAKDDWLRRAAGWSLHQIRRAWHRFLHVPKQPARAPH